MVGSAASVLKYRRVLLADKGRQLTFMTLADEQGVYDAVIFDDLWQDKRKLIANGATLLFKVNAFSQRRWHDALFGQGI